MRALRARMGGLAGQIPAILASAEAAAKRAAAGPGWKVRFPFSRHPAFTDEFVARAGGLANWGSDKPDDSLSEDMIFYAARSWEEDYAGAETALREYRERGWRPVLIGSHAGMPAGMPRELFLDNGAASGSMEESPINFIANLALGWMWIVEFVAALTRLGVHPHVMQSMFVPGAAEFNKSLEPKDALLPCDTAAPAGELADAYLCSVHWLLNEVARPEIQTLIASAAGLIREHLREGGRVITACLAHAVPGEIGRAVKNPYLNLGVPREADVREKTKSGDLLVYLGYVGIDNAYYTHGAWFRAAGLRLITSFIDDPLNPDNRAPDALVHIPQSWAFGDAEVPIPFPPGKMAPLSVINQLLLFRLLDDEVSMNYSEDQLKKI